MSATITATAIARLARQHLGRAASRSVRFMDHAAVDAVRAAAGRVGLDEPLLQWADSGMSLQALAESFVGRYAQAYGISTILEVAK